ncbi:hypothetical protein HN018_18650 [Lichenicola cladoniae]|uniref:Glycosyltransferase RgtA/B/C/D-like domain-containing protein n=1 Tax=Lichenicola cladoniae TaxID=1484109 RepID=A0A6M8HU47_9PROT|nr:hypothetical protein [Lichenicola cladoniae]NPD67568.1 hypothetical protein [Acetobacteraceae bacterium]QKE91786.1 hypothetical protein HN018_18650 [Lichenicola cladoniae]
MRRAPASLDMLLLAGGALVAYLLLGPILTIPRHIPLNYNEGWNAYFDSRAANMETGPLYPGSDSLVFNNYPPLSFYLVGAFGRFVVGDMIVAGRIVALLSLLASAGLLGLCIRHLGGSVRGGLTGSVVFLLFAGTFFREYLAMDDPQWLAHALMLGGLATLLRGHRSGTLPARDVVMAALLVLAGGFVKHSLVGIPLAATLWLAWFHPRSAVIWVATAMAGLGAGLLLTRLADGHAAFDDVLRHHRIFRLWRLVKALGRLVPLLPMGIIAVVLWRDRGRRDPAVLFAGLFTLIAVVTGAVQRLGEGVYYNAHFETLIALCLMTGLAVSRVTSTGFDIRDHAFGQGALAIFAILPLIVTAPWQIGRAWDDIAARHARERLWQPTIARLAATSGPAACEMLSLCYWAHKPFTIDFFNLNQSIMTGGSIAAFQSMTEHHRLGMIEYRPGSSIHEDALRKFGHDPLIDIVGPFYTPVQAGPDGIVLLAARDPA